MSTVPILLESRLSDPKLLELSSGKSSESSSSDVKEELTFFLVAAFKSFYF